LPVLAASHVQVFSRRSFRGLELTWFSGSYTTKPTRKRALNDDSDFRFGEATVSASVYVKYGPQIASKVGFESVDISSKRRWNGDVLRFLW